MKFNKNQSGERGHRNHLEGEGTKTDRQGGGPSERRSLAGEQGAKVESENNSIRSHTQAGEVHGAGTLKEGSSLDQANEDRFGLHLGDDYRINRISGEQNEDVRRQTGTKNHMGGKVNGVGGGKSSGSAGHGSQSHSRGSSSSSNNNSGWVKKSGTTTGSANVNPKDYKGYEGGTPPSKLKSGGDHQHRGEFPPRTRQNPNDQGSSAGSH